MRKKKDPEKKDPGGRPTKLTKDFLAAAVEVLFIDKNAIILTDEELREEINEKLTEEARVSETRFQAWKAGDLKDKDDLLDEFRVLIKKAIRIQKTNLFEKMKDEPTHWQKWAWILERKFNEWNLRRREVLEVQGLEVGDTSNLTTEEQLNILTGVIGKDE